MERRAFAILGLLLCVPVFILAETDPESSEEQEKENIKESTVYENQTWSCPEGWLPYEDNDQVSCLVRTQQALSYRRAESHCGSLGAFLVSLDTKPKESFVKRLAKRGDRRNHWTGLYKEESSDSDFNYIWQRRSTAIRVTFENLPQQIKDYGGTYLERCGYISGYYNNLEVEDCDSEYFPICEKEVSCKPGHFGNKCERECHCLGESCDPQLHHTPGGVACKFGCQRTWMGAACDTKKEDAEIKYYCINSEDNGGKYVYIRIYTKGLRYRAIYGMTSNNVRGDWCNSTSYLGGSSNLTIIRIPVNNVTIEQMSSGECVGQQLGENTFNWEIVLKEVDGVLQEHDVKVNVTCDFSVADNLVRAGEYSTGGQENQLQEKLISPESTHDDVTLQVLQAYSGQPISEAVVGTSIVLEMEYALLQGSLLKRIHPHNCVAFSPDGQHIKQLLDHNGCPLSDSPVQAFSLADDKKIRTPWFNLFTFEHETSVTFRCSFDFCFTSDCEVGCRSGSRRRRDTQDVRDEGTHSITRTIRVLPSIPAKGNSQTEDYAPARPPAAPPGYDMGPFIYLNPVTCSLFLLILLIFLCMYIAFIRTLRKSVFDIRKEIEVRRSRDKFLHCGCVQQKDRDYVAP